MAYRDQPLGELALSIPRASALFRKYDMDYCCGGKQTLARAAARKELDVEVIEAELAKLAEQPIEKDWRSAPLAEIIDHIIVRYHDRHREQLPELILQATKVERVHADKPSVPKGLTKYLTMLHEELSSHMMKEEQILFPMIKQGMGSQAMGPISVMESEHDEAGELLECFQWNAEFDQQKVCEELADVMNYCLLMSAKLGVDAETIILQKLEKNREKYPVEKARGKSTKYDQL